MIPHGTQIFSSFEIVSKLADQYLVDTILLRHQQQQQIAHDSTTVHDIHRELKACVEEFIK